MKLLLALLAAVTLAGCSTTPQGTYVVANKEISPQAVQNDLRIVTQFAAKEGLRRDPHARAYFEAAVQVLNVALETGEYNPNKLDAALSNLSVNELESPVVKDAIQAALDLYSNHVADALTKKLDRTVYVKPLLLGIREGLVTALNQTP